MTEGKEQELLVNRIIALGKEKAIEIAKSILDYFHTDLKGTEYIDELLNIGMDYDRFGEPDKALKMYHKAEKRALAIGDRYGLGTIYSNIGVIYSQSKDYNKALQYYEKSLELVKEVNNKQEIGILYNNMGFLYKNILKYEESVSYYIKSLSYLTEVDDKFSMTASYFNLAEVFASVGDYETAVEHIDKCIAIDKELNLETLKSDIKFKESLISKFERKQGKEIHNKEIVSTLNIGAQPKETEKKEEKKSGISWLWRKND